MREASDTPTLRPWLLCLLALGAAWLASAPASAVASEYVTARYQGTLSASSWTWAAVGEHDGGSFKLQISWEASASSPLTGQARWHFTKLTGTVHYDNLGSGPTTETACDATLSESPSYESSSSNIAEVNRTASGEVEASAEAPISGVLQSSDEADSHCSARGAQFGLEYAVVNEIEHYNPSTAVKEAVTAALRPKATVPAGGPWSRRFDASASELDPTGGGGKDSLEISSSLLIGSTTGSASGPKPTSPPPYGPEFSKAKRAAFNDLRNSAIPNAEHYCLPYASALALGTTGVLVSGLGASGGGLFAVDGYLTAAALAPFCNATITRLVADYKTYRDPPRESIGLLARPASAQRVPLPSCSPYHGAQATFCARLRGSFGKLLKSASAVAAVAVAIEATVAREHAAHARASRSAVAAQDAHLRTLEAGLAARARAERRAGVLVARVLAASKVRFALTQGQSGEAIALVEANLARHRITPSDLQSVDSAAVMPAATDLLHDLERL